MLAIKPSLGQLIGGRYRQHPRYRGCVGHWIMTEGGGNTVYDLSGFANHGALNGGAWSTGQFGRALSLDGVDDHIVIGNLGNITARITVSAWVKLVNFGSFDSIVYDWAATAPNLDWQFRVNQTTGVLYFAYTTTGTFDSNKELAGSTAVTAGVWKHVAATYDGAEIRLWIDGKQDAIKAATGTINNTNTNVTIGIASDGTSHPFLGEIDNVRIHSRALTPNEILSLYTDPFLEFEPRRRYFYIAQEAIQEEGNSVPLLMQMRRRRVA